MVKESSRPATLKQPRSLLWADARTLLIVTFILGLAVGLIGGYFTAQQLVSNARQTVVSDIITIDEARTTVKK